MGNAAESLPGQLRFGSFELDLEFQELHKRGLKIRIPPQAFCVLSCLLENPGELVTREELFRRLWPENTHVEFEGNLNAIIRVLRGALGDSARNPRFIVTEPRLGYRFVAPVAPIVRPQPALPLPAPEVPRRRFARTAVLWSTLPLALLGMGMYWSAGKRAGHDLEIRAGVPQQLTHFLGVAGHPTFSPDGT